MSAITETWKSDVILRGLETWEIWQAHVTHDVVDLAERADWLVGQGYNYDRLFCWQRDDYHPSYGGATFRNRARRAVQKNSLRGIYTVVSCSQGVHPENRIGSTELGVMRALRDELGEEPGLIWEVGNELRKESHDDGTVQKGIDLFRSTGQPILWAISENTALKSPKRPRNQTVEGLHAGDVPDVRGLNRPILYIVDHLNDDGLDLRNPRSQVDRIDRAEVNGYAGFVGLGKWEASNEEYGLPSWGRQERLANWTSDTTRERIASFRGAADTSPDPGRPGKARPQRGELQYLNLRRLTDRRLAEGLDNKQIVESVQWRAHYRDWLQQIR